LFDNYTDPIILESFQKVNHMLQINI